MFSRAGPSVLTYCTAEWTGLCPVDAPGLGTRQSEERGIRRFYRFCVICKRQCVRYKLTLSSLQAASIMAPPAAALAPPKVPLLSPLALIYANPPPKRRTIPSARPNSRNTTVPTPPSRSTWPSRAPCLMFPRNGPCMVPEPGIMCLRARMGVSGSVSLSFCGGAGMAADLADYGVFLGEGDPRDVLVT